MIHVSSILLLILAALLLGLALMGLIPLALGIPSAALFIAVYAYALYSRMRFKPPEPKPPVPIGERATVVERLAPAGLVKIGGVYWRAICEDCEAEVGEEVLVVDYKNGALIVRK